MWKIRILLLIIFVGAFLTVVTTGRLLIISGTITFIATLLFGREVHNEE